MTTTTTPSRTGGGTVAAGWIFVILCPLIGFFLGLDAHQHGRQEDGRQIMVMSVVLAVLWAVVAVAATR